MRTLLRPELPARRARILVAEDDDEMRRILVETLEGVGYEVQEAADGQELLEVLGSALLDDSPLDLLVSDVRMPVASGFRVLHGLREGGCDLPVVLITAFGDALLHEQALDLGASAVLDKPFEAEELLAAVLRVLPRLTAEREGA